MSLAANSENVVELQPRDIAILRGLFDARVMTAEQIAAIYFGGRYEAARKRLMKLKLGDFIGQRPRRAYDPAILFLTRKAFMALIQSGTIADLPRISWKSLDKRVRVSPLTLQHELEVQDVRAAFHLAIEPLSHLELKEFNAWPARFQFQTANPAGKVVLVKPDGLIRIQETDTGGAAHEHLFFMELDRSTESHQVLTERAYCYRNFYRHGGMAIRRGSPPENFASYPFRVLMIFRSAERRNNMAANLLRMHPPILTQVWLTTLAEVTCDPLGAIWTRPADFRDVVAATPYAERERDHPIYRRNIGREVWIEDRIRKHPPFASADNAAKSLI